MQWKTKQVPCCFWLYWLTLIVLGAESGGVSTFSFTSIVGAPFGIASASVTLFFSLTTRIVKKLLNITRKKEKAW